MLTKVVLHPTALRTPPIMEPFGMLWCCRSIPNWGTDGKLMQFPPQSFRFGGLHSFRVQASDMGANAGDQWGKKN